MKMEQPRRCNRCNRPLNDPEDGTELCLFCKKIKHEDEGEAPYEYKEVCPHPKNQVSLLNGWYRCEACKGKWKSKIK